LSRKENWAGIGKMRETRSIIAGRRCKCGILHEKRMHKAKRLYRIIESLGYKAVVASN
jgi:hypothetical protein